MSQNFAPKIAASKRTVENIISVSTKLFLEKGFEKTSLNDISTAMGMSKGAVFHHFKTKEDILNAVFAKQAEISEQVISGWLKEMEGLSAREKIITLMERNFEDTRLRRLDSLVYSIASNPRFIVAAMNDAVYKSGPVLAALFREGLKDGSIKTEYPDECAEAFFILLNIWCDPVIFKCNISRLNRRLKFLQQLMKQMGVGILNDKIIKSYITFIKKIYIKVK